MCAEAHALFSSRLVRRPSAHRAGNALRVARASRRVVWTRCERCPQQGHGVLRGLLGQDVQADCLFVRRRKTDVLREFMAVTTEPGTTDTAASALRYACADCLGEIVCRATVARPHAHAVVPPDELAAIARSFADELAEARTARANDASERAARRQAELRATVAAASATAHAVFEELETALLGARTSEDLLCALVEGSLTDLAKALPPVTRAFLGTFFDLVAEKKGSAAARAVSMLCTQGVPALRIALTRPLFVAATGEANRRPYPRVRHVSNAAARRRRTCARPLTSPWPPRSTPQPCSARFWRQSSPTSSRPRSSLQSCLR